VPVYGYRAPTFSITKETQWALPILVEEGYAYDSSIFPVLHDRYGVYGANPHCHEIQTASGTLWEVPPSTVRLAGVPLPIAGGGYFRLFPYPVTQFLLRKEEASGHPLVLYIHPWELDPEQPRMSGPVLSRFRHYINLTKTEGRMRRLLSDFAFSSIAEIIQPLLDLQNVRGVAESLKPKSFYTGH
jgi:polysaccharide deacetylase family protein (PEP-CTERM system associated)